MAEVWGWERFFKNLKPFWQQQTKRLSHKSAWWSKLSTCISSTWLLQRPCTYTCTCVTQYLSSSKVTLTSSIPRSSWIWLASKWFKYCKEGKSVAWHEQERLTQSLDLLWSERFRVLKRTFPSPKLQPFLLVKGVITKKSITSNYFTQHRVNIFKITQRRMNTDVFLLQTGCHRLALTISRYWFDAWKNCITNGI